MIKNFSTGIAVVLMVVVVMVVLELTALSAPPSPASVRLSNLAHTIQHSYSKVPVELGPKFGQIIQLDKLTYYSTAT